MGRAQLTRSWKDHTPPGKVSEVKTGMEDKEKRLPVKDGDHAGPVLPVDERSWCSNSEIVNTVTVSGHIAATGDRIAADFLAMEVGLAPRYGMVAFAGRYPCGSGRSRRFGVNSFT